MQRELKVSSRWRFVPGVAYGLQQSAILGYVQVGLDADFDFRDLDTAMERFIVELTPRTPPDWNATRALACRAAFWTSAVQRQNKVPVSSHHLLRIQQAPAGPLETYLAALPASSPTAAQAALNWVTETVTTLLRPQPVDDESIAGIQDRYERLRKGLRAHALGGQNPVYIHQAAWEMDIPIRHLATGVFLLGQGRTSRWLRSSISDQTSSLGVTLARDKMATAAVLRQAGLPAPTHALASSPDQALELARRYGYPVVIKPTDQEQGRGVFADLRNDPAVVQAFHAARAVSSNILVEKHFQGDGHRLTVSHGKVITATRKLPGGVTGDGIHSIEQLVDQLRLKPAKRELHAPVKPPVDLDEEALGLLDQQGLSRDTVPALDRYICLRRRNNASAGGTTIVLSLDQVHPDNLRLATRAANALRLDIAGVDLLIADISKSWLETGALICEVNAQPQMGQNPIYRVLADLTGHESRIPVHLLVTASPNAPRILAMVAELARTLGCNGIAMQQGIWIDSLRITGAQANSFVAARILLTCPETRAALLVMSKKDILAYGLPSDRLDSVRVFANDNVAAFQDESFTELIRMIQPHTDRLLSIQSSTARRTHPSGENR